MRSLRRQRGFNLLELTVVVGVLALLTSAATGTYEMFQQSRSHTASRAQLGQARLALRAFTLRNKHLPCPDSSPQGDAGRENGGASGCAAGLTVGWLPYESLGLALPDRNARIRYAVHRSSTADLAKPSAASAEFSDQDGSGGLLAALARAAQATPVTALPFYKLPTANAAYPTETPSSPDLPCDGGGETVNPAYALIAPGMDMDQSSGNAPGFDTMNNAIARGTALCMAPPERPSSFRYDDQVLAESSTTLLGWLTSLER